MNINFGPEYLFFLKGFGISNTLFTSILTSLILIGLALAFKKNFKRLPKAKSLQNFLEFIGEKLYQFIYSVTGSQKLAEQIFPLIATFFIFILTANLLGLLPGFLGSLVLKFGTRKVPLFRSPNSDWNNTLALAVISVIAIQYFGIKNLGWKRYLKRFFDFTNPLKIFLGFFEFLSDITKILSLSLRLFGNVLAGEITLIVMSFLLPYLVPLPFMILELVIGILQAFIFSALSLIFIRSSQTELELKVVTK